MVVGRAGRRIGRHRPAGHRRPSSASSRCRPHGRLRRHPHRRRRHRLRQRTLMLGAGTVAGHAGGQPARRTRSTGCTPSGCSTTIRCCTEDERPVPLLGGYGAAQRRARSSTRVDVVIVTFGSAPGALLVAAAPGLRPAGLRDLLRPAALRAAHGHQGDRGPLGHPAAPDAPGSLPDRRLERQADQRRRPLRGWPCWCSPRCCSSARWSAGWRPGAVLFRQTRDRSRRPAVHAAQVLLAAPGRASRGHHPLEHRRGRPGRPGRPVPAPDVAATSCRSCGTSCAAT